MDRSPLGRLPAELRNKVYELVLLQQSPVRIFLGPKLKPRREVYGSADKQDDNLTQICEQFRVFVKFERKSRQLFFNGTDTHARALTQACKQIRAESLPLYFSANAFEIPLKGAEYPPEYTHMGPWRPRCMPGCHNNSDAMGMMIEPFTTFLDFIHSINVTSIRSLTVFAGIMAFGCRRGSRFPTQRYHDYLSDVYRITLDEARERTDGPFSFQFDVEALIQDWMVRYEYLVVSRMSINAPDLNTSLQQNREALQEIASKTPILGTQRDVRFLLRWMEKLSR